MHLPGFSRVLLGRADPPATPDTSSYAGSIIACAVSTWVICGVFVSARFYARGRIQHVLGKEDWCVLVAFLLALGFTIATIYECKYGMGSHLATITPENLSKYIQASWVSTLFYQLSLAVSKASILLLYIRLFRFHYARTVAWVLLAIVVIYNIWGVYSTVTVCIPLEAYWNPAVHGDCHPVSYMWAAIGLHIGTDFLIFLLPIPVISSMMALSRRQKAGLILVFAMGFFVCLISILRIVWIKQLYYSTDFLWDYVSINYWNSLEVNCAILLPCLVVLKPLFRKLWPGSFSVDHEELGGFDSPAAAANYKKKRFMWPARPGGVGMTPREGVGLKDVGSRDKEKGLVHGVREPEGIHVRGDSV